MGPTRQNWVGSIDPRRSFQNNIKYKVDRDAVAAMDSSSGGRGLGSFREERSQTENAQRIRVHRHKLCPLQKTIHSAKVVLNEYTRVGQKLCPAPPRRKKGFDVRVGKVARYHPPGSKRITEFPEGYVVAVIHGHIRKFVIIDANKRKLSSSCKKRRLTDLIAVDEENAWRETE
jgi:hypothetical protein